MYDNNPLFPMSLPAVRGVIRRILPCVRFSGPIRGFAHPWDFKSPVQAVCKKQKIANHAAIFAEYRPMKMSAFGLY